MNFKGHVSDVCKRASKQLGVLLRLRNMIPMHAKLQIYKSAILPLLTYCHVVWHFCCLSDTRKLERVQEKALRVIYCNRNDTYEDLLKMAKLPTLYNRRLQDIAILMYKVKHNQCPKYKSDLFKRTWCNYSLRNSDFSIPRISTVTFGKHSVSALGPDECYVRN